MVDISQTYRPFLVCVCLAVFAKEDHCSFPRYNSELIRLRKDLKLCKTRVACQNKLISKYHNRLDEYDKKFEENTKKFSTLIQVSSRGHC